MPMTDTREKVRGSIIKHIRGQEPHRAAAGPRPFTTSQRSFSTVINLIITYQPEPHISHWLQSSQAMSASSFCTSEQREKQRESLRRVAGSPNLSARTRPSGKYVILNPSSTAVSISIVIMPPKKMRSPVRQRPRAVQRRPPSRELLWSSESPRRCRQSLKTRGAGGYDITGH